MRRSTTTLLAAFGSGLAILVASAVGCDAPAVTPSPPANDAAVADVREAGVPDATAPDTAVPEPTPPRPEFVPEGWELWTGFKKAAQIYLPTRKEVLPPPAKWEPCDPVFFPDNPGGTACEEWATVEPGQTGVGTMSAFWNFTPPPSGGRFLLPQMRTFGRYLTWVVVDVATGEPLNALMAASPAWVANPSWPSATGTFYRVGEYGTPGPVTGYVIAPHDPSLPQVVGTYPNSASSFVLGDSLLGLQVVGAVGQGPWSNPRAQLLLADPRLQPLISFYRGDTAYLETTGGVNRRIYQIARPGAALETWFDNAQNLYAESNLATDGTDLAWVHYEGCTTSGAESCSSHDFYVAKLPSPGARPVGRRVRSSSLLFPRTTVGCGHIAASGGYKDYHSELRVIRIADGVSFLRRQMDATKEYGYTTPLAVTCEHVYVIRSPRMAGQLATVVRIRLDALGPGIPPD